MQLEGIQDLIFSDRYALKEPDRSKLEVGDKVVVIVSTEGEWERRSVATVIGVDHEEKEAKLRLADTEEEIVRSFSVIDKCLETSPAQMWDRMARWLPAKTEKKDSVEFYQKEFRWLLDDFKFLPGGRINTSLGSEELKNLTDSVPPGFSGFNNTLFNCFSINIEPEDPRFGMDSREAIMDTLKNMVSIQALGGGVGIPLSALRPNNAYIQGVNGKSSGAVSWGALFSEATGKVSQGGCFSEEVRIATNKGLIPAEDLYNRIKSGEEFYALTHQGRRLITTAFNNGIKETYEVKTKRGYSVCVTPDHGMGVIDESGEITTIPLNELKIGDNVLILLGDGCDGEAPKLNQSKYNASKQATNLNADVLLPQEMNEELAYLLGYSYGNGYVYDDKCLRISVPLERVDIIERLKCYAKTLFNLEAIIRQGGGKCVEVVYYSRILIEWLKENRLLKEKTECITMPDIFFSSPSNITGAFVSGYFDADGSDRDIKAGYGFDSVSSNFLSDLQIVLAINGIFSSLSVYKRKEEGWRDLYRLSVTGPIFKRKMYNFMNMSLKKNIRPNFGRYDRTSRYPFSVIDACGIEPNQWRKLTSDQSGYVSYRVLNTISSKNPKNIKLKHTLNVVPDEIISIEKQSATNVYDFEVEDVHMLSGSAFYTSNSRRGATLLGLHINHPDIVEFIFSKVKKSEISSIKSKWQSKFPKANFIAHGIENANISVFITDEFMNAVRDNKDWDLIFPDYEAVGKDVYNAEWDGDVKSWIDKGYPVKVYDTVKARDLWDCISESAWMSAEPGIIYIDTMQKENNGWYYSPIICTNPCVTGDTDILTSKGYVSIKDVVGQEVDVWNGFEFSKVTPKITGENQKILDITFSDGSELSCTPYHKFYIVEGKKTKEVIAQDLDIGDKLIKWNYPVIEGTKSFKDAYTQGFYSGDGTLDKDRDRKVIWLYEKKHGLLKYLDYEHNYGINQGRYGLKLSDEYKDKDFVPDATYTISYRLQWLAGLIDSDGTRNSKDGAICISSIDKPFLIKTKKMLSTLGVPSTVSFAKPGGLRVMPDGSGSKKEYFTQDLFRLTISAYYIRELISLGLETYRVDISGDPNRNSSRFIYVTSVVEREELEEYVYCFNEPKRHLGCFNGIVTGQCGEIPLPNWGICLLGHINLPKFVEGPIGEGEINWDELAKAIHLGVRFLDNITDYNPYHDARNERAQKESRRIGLGTLGLGEALIRLGVRYGKDSVDVIDEIYKFIAVEAYKASIDLAEEKGSFPAFHYDSFIKSEYMQRLLPHLPTSYKEKLSKTGIRSVALLTAAPTGSTGTMVGTSTGIEPYFAFTYYRSGRLGTREINERIVQEYLDENSLDEKAKLPDYFVEANDIPLREHIIVQGAIQKWLDQSIAKTANAPNNATIKDVQELYELAYDLGVKGCTVYRDGSRDTQVLSSESNETTDDSDVDTTTANKGTPENTKKTYRPNVIYGQTEKIHMPDGKLYVTANSTEKDGVVEVFINGGEGNTEISALCNYVGRLISVMRKYGIPLEEIIQQGDKVPGGQPFWYKGDLDDKGRLIANIPSALSHVLSRFGGNKHNYSAYRGQKCPSCGGVLRDEEGCYNCMDCGYSKCS